VTLVLSLLLMGTVLAYVAYPLVRTPRREQEGEEGGELLGRRDATLGAIKELQFDYELGNLSPQEHRELEGKYRAKAMAILRELDQAPPQGAEAIEREVSALRTRLKAPPQKAEAIEDEVKALREKVRAGRFCSQCGSPAEAGDRFCSRCGAPLKTEKA